MSRHYPPGSLPSVLRRRANRITTDMDDLANREHFFSVADGVAGGNFAFTATAATTLTGSGTVTYRIGGETYFAAVGNVTLQDRGDIVDTKYGAWRILIDRTGALSAQDSGAVMAFANAEDALLSLSSVAPTANTAVLGYLVLQASGAAFNIGTTNLNAGTVANLAVYHVRQPVKQASGLTAALGGSVVANSGVNTLAVPTLDVKRNGVRLAQIAVEAGHAMDDADTVATTKWGGWLLVTNLAGTGVYAIAANGIAGAVSAMTYATEALALAALDALTDNLPALFVPVARITLYNSAGGTFTAGTTNWTGLTRNITPATVSTWDRTDLTGFDTHRINPPAVPDALTAVAV